MMNKNLKNKSLTHKQQLFVREYCLDQNATQAAKRAGYSNKSAYSQGQRLLKNVEIKKLIDSFAQEHCAELDVSASGYRGGSEA